MTLATFSAFFEWRKTEASILVSNFNRTYYIVDESLHLFIMKTQNSKHWQNIINHNSSEVICQVSCPYILFLHAEYQAYPDTTPTLSNTYSYDMYCKTPVLICILLYLLYLYTQCYCTSTTVLDILLYLYPVPVSYIPVLVSNTPVPVSVSVSGIVAIHILYQ